VQLQRPIFGSLGNGTTIQHPQTGAYVLPCDLMQPKDTALTLTLGGTEFGVQFRDIMYVDIDYGTVSAGQSADCQAGRRLPNFQDSALGCSCRVREPSPPQVLIDLAVDDELILLGGTFLVNVSTRFGRTRHHPLNHEVYHSVNTQTGEVTMYGLKG